MERRSTVAFQTHSSNSVSESSSKINENYHLNLHRKYFIIIHEFLGVGASLGIVGSLIFFKRRMWPIYGGSFFGLGGKLMRKILS